MDYPDVYPVELHGDRIHLREVDPTDAPAAMAWAADPEYFRYSAWDAVGTQAEEQLFLRIAHADARSRPRRQYSLGIVWEASGELIGMARIGISEPAHRGGDIGYGLRRDRWGSGIATEAARLVVDFGFDRLGLHRIFAYHHPDNVASGRVLQKLGMQREGVLRENQFAHGRWRDSVVYAVLEHEWAAAGN